MTNSSDEAQAVSRLDVYDKATGQVIESLPVDDVSAVDLAVVRAREAQFSWANMGAKERAKLLKRARKEVVLAREGIISALTRETGKAPFDVMGELFSVCQTLTYLAKKSPRWLKPQKVSTRPLLGKKGRIFYRPHGVVGVIAPWNAPLTLAIGDVLPALFAGNAVIVKPSEITPLAVKATVDALNRVLPEGVLQVLIGKGETGAALVERIDMVAVTGSCETGRRVMEAASKRLTPVLLELGGKDPMLILKDANIDRAVNAAAWGSCFMTGQVCMSVERIYVERAVADEFQSKLVAKLEKLRTGPELATTEMDYGPFIGPLQVGIVETLIADATDHGAEIVIGGKRLQTGEGGTYFQATLMTGVDHSMRIMREELFGPVVGLMVVDNEEQAISLANDSIFGLNASVWTKNISHGIDIAQRIEAGNVCVNDCVLNAGVQALPFGGAKQSGVGSRHGGAEGLRQFCLKQSVMIESRSRKTEMVWFPYRGNIVKKFEKLMTFLYGR